ncbi:MAG TPA: hypothetical protein VFN23_18910 [Ktedonobacteraceae bacterium]|nr:hypothetical protein [Ktedonobacteraceae bacterium]
MAFTHSTRYYNPNTKTWPQQDPVGGSLANPNAINRYAYDDVYCVLW